MSILLSTPSKPLSLILLFSLSRIAVHKSLTSASLFVALKSSRPSKKPIVRSIHKIYSSSSSKHAMSFVHDRSGSEKGSLRDCDYPRPLHPGGFTLPPLVEDRLSIMITSAAPCQQRDGKNNNKTIDQSNNGLPPVDAKRLQTKLLIVKPTDMESLWEWYAYTKRQHDADPSWGRVWPTAMALSRWILRALHVKKELVYSDDDDGSIRKGNDTPSLMIRATHALQTSWHVVEVGCGLGAAGLVYATTIMDVITNKKNNNRSERRTVTFLDKEPYALHCVMASAVTNDITTGPIIPSSSSSPSSLENKIAAHDVVGEEQNNGIKDYSEMSQSSALSSSSMITVRAAMDDWSLPLSCCAANKGDNNTNKESRTNNNKYAPSSPEIKNMCFGDLCLPTEDVNEKNTIVIIASDILYDPSSMISLAKKLNKLVHPIHGGYILIADPEQERTPGCRVTFVECVRNLGGEVEIFPIEGVNDDVRISSSLASLYDAPDVDIDGNFNKLVMIIVYFQGQADH